MSDYLTDEEQLDRLRGWWSANGLYMVIAVVIAVIGVVGWNYYQNHRTEQITSASELYADYLSAEGAERETIEATLAREFPDTTYRAFVLLRQAGERMAEEDAAASETLLREALEVAPASELEDLIRLRLARVLVALDRSDEALTLLGQVAGLGYRAVVQELKGDILLARGERAAAFEAYSAALEEVGANVQRPILEMKVADTADAGEVAMADKDQPTEEPVDEPGEPSADDGMEATEAPADEMPESSVDEPLGDEAQATGDAPAAETAGANDDA